MQTVNWRSQRVKTEYRQELHHTQTIRREVLGFRLLQERDNDEGN
jgi:hypothetical protein